ncbi:MAG: hypothetical protein LUC34_08235 [Campylobacter sp.]|nr:hypothetical protein [Campylobacter sp.]
MLYKNKILNKDEIKHKICSDIKFLALFIIFVFFTNAQAQSMPSFDCAKAKIRVEKAICGNENLAKMDSDMKKTFDIIMGKYDLAHMEKTSQEEIKPYLRIFKNSQIDWIKNIRNRCEDKNNQEIVPCLSDAYNSRIQSFFAGYDASEGVIINQHTDCPDHAYQEDINGIAFDEPSVVFDDMLRKNKAFYRHIRSTMREDISNLYKAGEYKILAKTLSDYKSRIKESDYDYIRNGEDTHSYTYKITVLDATSDEDYVACINIRKTNSDPAFDDERQSSDYHPYCILIKKPDYAKGSDKYENITKLYEDISNANLPRIDYKNSNALFSYSADTAIFLDENTSMQYHSFPFSDRTAEHIVTKRGGRYVTFLGVKDKFFYKIYALSKQKNRKLLCRIPINIRYDPEYFKQFSKLNPNIQDKFESFRQISDEILYN